MRQIILPRLVDYTSSSGAVCFVLLLCFVLKKKGPVEGPFDRKKLC